MEGEQEEAGALVLGRSVLIILMRCTGLLDCWHARLYRSRGLLAAGSAHLSVLTLSARAHTLTGYSKEVDWWALGAIMFEVRRLCRL